MFPGVLALLEQSLRVDSRAWGPHLSRLGLMVAINIAVSYASTTSWMFGAPGLRFCQYIVSLNLIFMTLMGVGFFSTAITEEKEEDTLGLMLMAGISPLGILLGKSVGRLVQALLLMAVQYPFTLLAVTMGGVTQEQVRAVYVAMFAYMVMLAGIGLLCSTLAQRNRSASKWLTIFIFIYGAIPSIAIWYIKRTSVALSQPSYWTNWVAQSCVYFQTNVILSTGFSETLWSHQVVTNLSLGGLGFVFSWILFGFSIRDPSSEASSRGWVTRNRGLIRTFSPGRPAFDPFIWKDFHFVAGGIATTFTRIAFYGLLYFCILVYSLISRSTNPALDVWYHATTIYIALMAYVITFDAAMLVSQSFHDEIRGQTLATLLMLPIPSGQILYRKMAGTLMGWLPGVACMLIAMIALPGGPDFMSRIFPWQSPGPGFMFISHFILVPHAAALAAMYVRWGGLPIGIGVGIAAISLTVFVITAFHIGPDDLSVFLIGFIVVITCLACHIAVWLRAEALAAR